MDESFMSLVRWAGLAAVVLGAAWLLRAVFGKKQDDPHHVQVECGCGWSGKTSRYKPRCAKCGANL